MSYRLELNENGGVTMRKKILLIDDEHVVLDYYQELFEEIGKYEVLSAGTVAQGKEMLAKHDFDLVISDYVMPDGTGVDVLSFLRKQKSNVPVVLVSGYTGGLAESLGEHRFEFILTKPVSISSFTKLCERVFKAQHPAA